MTEFQPGDVFAEHRIEGVLGRGGMGIVYRARQLTLDRSVALKLIAEHLASDESFRSRFLREVQAAAAIEHPNVLPVHYAGEADGRLFVSMPLVEGGDLHALLAERGRLKPQEAVDLMEQIAAGLDAAHSAGLIHRDVKPANILVDGRGRALLTDFGVARLRGAKTTLTATGQMIGTLDYVAPEQIEASGVSERSDVYSLGCVLFEMLTGEAVFADRESLTAKLSAHLNAEPPAARRLAPETPEELDAVIAKAMAKSPDDRFASAGDLYDAARAALPVPQPETKIMDGGGGGRGDDDETVPGDRPSNGAKPRRLLPWALGGAAAAVLAIVALVGVLALGSGDSSDEEPQAPAATVSTESTESPGSGSDPSQVAPVVSVSAADNPDDTITISAQYCDRTGGQVREFRYRFELVTEVGKVVHGDTAEANERLACPDPISITFDDNFEAGSYTAVVVVENLTNEVSGSGRDALTIR